MYLKSTFQINTKFSPTKLSEKLKIFIRNNQDYNLLEFINTHRFYGSVSDKKFEISRYTPQNSIYNYTSNIVDQLYIIQGKINEEDTGTNISVTIKINPLTFKVLNIFYGILFLLVIFNHFQHNIDIRNFIAGTIVSIYFVINLVFLIMYPINKKILVDIFKD